MADATAATMATELRHQLKDSNALARNFADAELIAYLNDGVEFVFQQLVATWPDYFNQTDETLNATGTNSVTLPAGTYKVLIVEDANGAALPHLNAARYADTGARGYIIKDSKVYIVGTTGTNKVFYVTKPTRIALLATAVPLSDKFYLVIKEFAALKGKARQGEPTDFKTITEMVAAQIASLKPEAGMRHIRSWAASAGTSAVSDYIHEIRYELGDVDAEDVLFPDGELIAYLNDATRMLYNFITSHYADFWMNTGLTFSATSNIVSGTAFYALPADCFHVMYVTKAGVSLPRLAFERTLDADAAGFYLKDSKVYLYPKPTAYLANGLVVYYVPNPTRLTTTAGVVPLDTTFREFVKGYAVMKGRARLDKTIADTSVLFEMMRQQLCAHMTAASLATDARSVVPGMRTI